nr:Hypothetical protein FSTVLC9_362 [Faustovirus]
MSAATTVSTNTVASMPLKCKCTTSDGKIVVAESATVKWCKFFSNMLEDIGASDASAQSDPDNDESMAVVICDQGMFNFVNQFCKFYDGAPYTYALIDEYDVHGKLTRRADIECGRPTIKFAPLYDMAKNACKSDTKKYDKRKLAWRWFNKALDAAEYFDCDPLITEVNRSMAYLLTGMDHQALYKITDIESDIWIHASNEVLQERINNSTPKLNHTEIFDAIYKTIAPQPVEEETTEWSEPPTNNDTTAELQWINNRINGDAEDAAIGAILNNFD